MHVMVREGGTVGSHGGLGEDDLVGLSGAGLDYRELLRDALFHAALCEADLEKTLVIGVGVMIGVDGWVEVRPLRKVIKHLPLSPHLYG